MIYKVFETNGFGLVKVPNQYLFVVGEGIFYLNSHIKYESLYINLSL